MARYKKIIIKFFQLILIHFTVALILDLPGITLPVFFTDLLQAAAIAAAEIYKDAAR